MSFNLYLKSFVIQNAKRSLLAKHGCCVRLPVSFYSSDDSENKDLIKQNDDTSKDTKKSEIGEVNTDNAELAKAKLDNLLRSMATSMSEINTPSVITEKLAKPVRPEKTEFKPEIRYDEISAGINVRLVKAAKTVAKTMGHTDYEQSALFHILKTHDEETVAVKAGHVVNVDLSKIVDGMQVVKKGEARVKITDESMPAAVARQEKVERTPIPEFDKRKKSKSVTSRSIDRINIYRGEALAIFSKDETKENESTERLIPPTVLDTWEKLRKEELKMMATHPPNNAFEEMIRWTEQGKLWRYPIDNEQGLHREAEVPFYDHVFLEHWLEGFPTQGPIRHFMELMLLGLSKNPYMTVERKKAYIEWFKTYFHEKEDILRQTGTL